jgi:hypothetical protein
MRLVLLSAMVLLSACAPTVSDRPCPRVTEFSPAIQRQAAEELDRLGPGSATGRMLDALAVDRAFNRAICR